MPSKIAAGVFPGKATHAKASLESSRTDMAANFRILYCLFVISHSRCHCGASE
jgi:hypothetical protein